MSVAQASDEQPKKITTEMVKELRERTNAGIMDAKRALEESGGDMDAAEVILRKKGMASAAKKAGREANQGLIFQYIHGGRIGVLMELNCETDFVARNETFQDLGRDIAQHIVGMAPKYINAEDMPDDERERERKLHDGSDVEVDRKLVLLAQPFVRNPKVSIGEMVQTAIGTLGENIQVRRFVRYELGEAMQTIPATVGE